MRSRPIVAVVAVLAVALIAGLGLALGRSALDQKPSSSIADSPGPSASQDGSPTISLVATAHVDGLFDVALTHEPTVGPGQSKLWFADGAWWATLVAQTTQELHIARLDPVTQTWVDTGTLVDERLHVHADTLWDGTHLTIVTAGNKPTASQAVRISQFHYDPKLRRFTIDPDLPIALTAAGVDDPILARDSSGVLWLAYVDQTKLVLRHTLGDALHWTPAAPPPIAGADGAIRAAALTADGSRVTLVWNPVNDATLEVGQHVDGTAPGTWVADSTKVAELANAPGGLSIRTLAATGGSRLFVAFETAPDRGPNANSLAPGAIVMVREADGSWSNVLLARVKDHLTDPILVIDEQHATIVVIASIAGSGTIVYKQSPLDRLSFDSGRGTDLMASATDPNLRNPTTTKQAVDLASGLVVLAADDGTGHYVHALLSSSEAPTGGPSPSGPAGSPPPFAADAHPVLLHDTFDPWAVGTRSPPDWLPGPQSGGAGQLEVIALPTAAHHSLLIRTTSAAGSIRACTDFAPTAAGTITVFEVFRLAGTGTSDTTVGSIRGPGGEAVSVRVTKHRLLAYYRGQAKLTTTVVMRTGLWYRSTIVVRPATHTYDWIVADAAGRVIARITGIAWRQAAVPALDTVCAQAPQGRGGAILLDDVEVRR